MPTHHSLVISREAYGDLDEITDYIALDSVDASERVYFRLIERMQILEDFPESGRVVEEVKPYTAKEHRELIESPYPNADAHKNSHRTSISKLFSVATNTDVRRSSAAFATRCRNKRQRHFFATFFLLKRKK